MVKSLPSLILHLIFQDDSADSTSTSGRRRKSKFNVREILNIQERKPASSPSPVGRKSPTDGKSPPNTNTTTKSPATIKPTVNTKSPTKSPNDKRLKPSDSDASPTISESIVSCNGGDDPLLEPGNLGRSDKVFDLDDTVSSERTNVEVKCSDEGEVKEVKGSEEGGVKRKREDGEMDRRRGGGKEENLKSCQDLETSCDSRTPMDTPLPASPAPSVHVGNGLDRGADPEDTKEDLEGAETGSEEGTPSEKENHPAPLVEAVKVSIIIDTVLN